MKEKTRTKDHIDMSTKTAKYFVAQRVKGMSKTQAVKVAGISDVRNVSNYENSVTYKALEAKYKDVMLKHIGFDEVADRHTKLIKQDQDKSASLNAIKLFLDRVEPDVQEKNDSDQMIVVLRAG